MKKKIVILGALGYLGTELCKIYSGESWKNKILAVDSRFVSERVNQLKEWGIEFLQGHILDKEFLKKNLNDADIIHHLAGVTDVAYVKSEANSELDKKILLATQMLSAEFCIKYIWDPGIDSGSEDSYIYDFDYILGFQNHLTREELESALFNIRNNSNSRSNINNIGST